VSYTKLSNLSAEDNKNPINYLREIDKDLTRIGIYLGSGITENVAVAKVGGGTRTLTIRNGIITGYVDS